MPGFFFWVIQPFLAMVWFHLSLLDYVMGFLRLNHNSEHHCGCKMPTGKVRLCLPWCWVCIFHHLSLTVQLHVLWERKEIHPG